MIVQYPDGFYFDEFGPYRTEQDAQVAMLLTALEGIYVDEIEASALLAQS